MQGAAGAGRLVSARPGWRGWLAVMGRPTWHSPPDPIGRARFRCCGFRFSEAPLGSLLERLEDLGRFGTAAV